MHFTLKIALRYLIARKSTQVIQLIAGISVLGLSVGTAALILVLSVFNGFEDLIMGMYGRFNPDIRITAASGKFFREDSAVLKRIILVPGVDAVSGTLEEIAFFTCGEKQDFGMLKGVDSMYSRVSYLDSSIREGTYLAENSLSYQAISGLGLRNKLGINLDDPFASLTVYMPRSQVGNLLSNPFRRRSLKPTGTFMIQQEYDNQYVFTTLDVARDLMGNKDLLSAWELKTDGTQPIASVVKTLEGILGEEFRIQDYYAQEEPFIRLMQLEKWLSFAIVGFMLLLVACNFIGALWMIVLDKKKDVAVLKSMGATDRDVRNLFLWEGLLLTLVGLLSGMALSLLLYAAQKTFQLVQIPGSFVVDSYPMALRSLDFAVVSATVIAIGMLATLPAAFRAMRMTTRDRMV